MLTDMPLILSDELQLLGHITEVHTVAIECRACVIFEVKLIKRDLTPLVGIVCVPVLHPASADSPAWQHAGHISS